MKHLKKIATFCCVMLIAMSALTISSCSKDDSEPTNREILTSSQWANTSEDMPIFLDIDYSSKGNLVYILTAPGLGNLKQTIPILSFVEGDFDGFEFKLITNSSLFPDASIRVNDENSISVKVNSVVLDFVRVESKLDISTMPEVNFEEMM